MKFVDEFREPLLVTELSKKISKIVTRTKAHPWKIMEVCGGQTHSILRYGLDRLIPDSVELLHGPGCPVCVTAPEILDLAANLALDAKVILCTYGDMMRVPSSQMTNFFSVRARGGDIRMVYSPMESIRMAQENPDKEVVFLAVGFETTAPAHALAVTLAQRSKIKNFSMLLAHVLVPPAIEMILQDPEQQVQGFLAAGHVNTIMGCTEYESLATKYNIPFVVTGFEPTDILQGILMCVTQLEEGRGEVENQYARSVLREGNLTAIHLVQEVFEIADAHWRGLGKIKKSGLRFRSPYVEFDATLKFSKCHSVSSETSLTQTSPQNSTCQSGQILLGKIKPDGCPSFGTLCTPETPLGPTMVSTEGACSAYYKYRRVENESQLSTTL